MRTYTLRGCRSSLWTCRCEGTEHIGYCARIIDILLATKPQPKVLVVEQAQIQAAGRFTAERLDIAECYRVEFGQWERVRQDVVRFPLSGWNVLKDNPPLVKRNLTYGAKRQPNATSLYRSPPR